MLERADPGPSTCRWGTRGGRCCRSRSARRPCGTRSVRRTPLRGTPHRTPRGLPPRRTPPPVTTTTRRACSGRCPPSPARPHSVRASTPPACMSRRVHASLAAVCRVWCCPLCRGPWCSRACVGRLLAMPRSLESGRLAGSRPWMRRSCARCMIYALRSRATATRCCVFGRRPSTAVQCACHLRQPGGEYRSSEDVAV